MQIVKAGLRLEHKLCVHNGFLWFKSHRRQVDGEKIANSDFRSVDGAEDGDSHLPTLT